MNTPFTRQPLYFVIKIKDAELALTQTERDILGTIVAKVTRWRIAQGKAPIQGVFVEHDWPEHDGVWAAIERRCTPTPPAIEPAYPSPYRQKSEPLVWPDLECTHDYVATNDSAHRTCVYCKKAEPIEAPV